MRIVFMGANDIGWDCCKLLLEQGENIVGIFSIPQKFEASYAKNGVKNCRFRDFERLASKHNVPLFYVGSGKDKNAEAEIRELEPDLILVIGWYYMIPKSIREIPTKGIMGIHASLLPKYRGCAPLNWAIINGEKETGVTLFHISEGIDTGDVVAQKKFGIEDEDDISDLVRKSKEASLAILKETLPLIKRGKAPRIRQDESKTTQFPPRTPKDGEIDWSWSPERIKNFIRAQTKPYPGAFTYINGKKVTIWDADIEEVDE